MAGSFIRFKESVEPDTPPTDRAVLYVDEADKEVAVKKDDGSVQKFLLSVSSVFGRTGAVIALLGDYAASLITNDSSVVGATVKDALDNLDTLVAGKVDDVNGEEGSVNIFDILETQEDVDDTTRQNSTTVWEDAAVLTTSDLNGGVYRIDWDLTWNQDDTLSNFQAQILIDGVLAWYMAVEPKDLGADINHPASGFEIITLPAGSVDIQLQYRCESAGNEAEIYRSRIALQRWR